MVVLVFDRFRGSTRPISRRQTPFSILSNSGASRRPPSAHLVRCRACRRRSPHRTESGRSPFGGNPSQCLRTPNRILNSRPMPWRVARRAKRGTGVFRNAQGGPATGPALRFFPREIRRGGHTILGQRKCAVSTNCGDNRAMLNVFELDCFPERFSMISEA